MADYRPLPEDHEEVFHEYVHYGFSPEEGPSEYDPEDLPERAKLGSKRALYPDGSADAAPVSVCKHYWFDARVRGDVHAVPGLSAVATPPERRRQGHVRRLLAASLEESAAGGARFEFRGVEPLA